MIKNALLDYTPNSGWFNIGDYIQSLAAKQYFDKIDVLPQREFLHKKAEPFKLIMNGWFMYKTKNWPLSPTTKPLFVSFHLNSHIADSLLSKKKNTDYLKTQEPIGCRDYYTVNILKKYGVEAYYSSCLTTTLPKLENIEKNDDVIFFDVLYNEDKKAYYERIPRHYYKDLLRRKLPKLRDHKTYLAEFFPKEIVENAKFETAFYKAKNTTTEDRFKEAERLLKTFASAKLVITSRIHAALPCLAMGTPVIFIMGGLNNSSDLSRLDGIVQHFNMVNLDPNLDLSTLKNLHLMSLDDIDWKNPIPNPTNHTKYTKNLRDKCKSFTAN
ncbi:MAG: polysaccharide pyruvyl transferase family protein [Flavobacteriaceae bacterium]|nr:polysaccharide pyruvyl transferase family protein [Flavobacteriaceae bacterium]